MMSQVGSPPRMRGKGSARTTSQISFRITPAHAGKSPFDGLIIPSNGDHPRACGEKCADRGSGAGGQGSPPRMRGKAHWPLKAHPRCGITPAHAGKRPIWRRLRCWAWDHPRACGEKSTRQSPTGTKWGSPPRMRGKEPHADDAAVCPGITPAHAGKSPANWASLSVTRDHPRACGEKLDYPKKNQTTKGSPPRMRGKDFAPDRPQDNPGITPAHAGKRACPLPSCSTPRDHPRACGEKPSAPTTISRRTGSPPRMRGKAAEGGQREPPAGITPAHAGKRLSESSACWSGRDHPRACGEKISSSRLRICLWGSPPRMRGKASLPQLSNLQLGITPAHAGKRLKDP